MSNNDQEQDTREPANADPEQVILVLNRDQRRAIEILIKNERANIERVRRGNMGSPDHEATLMNADDLLEGIQEDIITACEQTRQSIIIWDYEDNEDDDGEPLDLRNYLINEFENDHIDCNIMEIRADVNVEVA